MRKLFFLFSFLFSQLFSYSQLKPCLDLTFNGCEQTIPPITPCTYMIVNTTLFDVVQYSGDYIIGSYTLVGMDNFQVNSIGTCQNVIDYLIVGGGGGGAIGGGGGGGVLTASNFSVSVGSYFVSVGSGGKGGDGNEGDQGENSTFYIYDAIGGGYGDYNISAGNGGSGGGAYLSYTFGLGTLGQGFDGGECDGLAGGGGGGATQLGGNASYPIAPNGGDGLESSITGVPIYYGGGGGGGCEVGGNLVGYGGLGGGGSGGGGGDYGCIQGTNGLGGGGGGGGLTGLYPGCRGGDGIVIIKWKYK